MVQPVLFMEHFLQNNAAMKLNDLTPHLNKIATLYLKNNKRKVGWVFIDSPQPITHEDPKHEDPKDVYFVCVQKGRKFLDAIESNNTKELTNHEKIPLKEIVRIRSRK